MRIVGGKFKGRKLVAPDGLDTRPTSDRARESIFNILEHQSWGRAALRAGRVLDVFAGTGALGLEAFSRGAASVTFLDNSETALKALRLNAKDMGTAQEIRATRTDVNNLPACEEAFDLVFMDAPYKSGLTDIALTALAQNGWMKQGCLCVIETSKKENWKPSENFEEIDMRKYGAAHVFFIKYKQEK